MAGITLKLQVEGNATKAVADVKQELVEVKAEAADAGKAIAAAVASPAVKDAAGRFRLASTAASFLSEKVRTAADAADQLNARMRRTAAIHEELTRKTDPLSIAFGRLASQLDHERMMLERINGPDREKAEALRTLDVLYKKGAISIEQYIAQVDRLGVSLQTTKTGIAGQNEALKKQIDTISTGPAPKAAGGGGMLDKLGGAGAGAVMGRLAGPLAIAGTAQQLLAIDDRWKSLSNSVLKFEKPGRMASQVLSDQVKASKELHQPIEEVINLYDAVADAGDQLYMTNKQLNDATTNLSKGMLLEGKSLADGARVMEQLQYAMSIGAISTRELKGIMKEFPAIADQWTSHLGVTRKELLEMARTGKLNVSELMLALSQGSDEVEEKWGKRSVTWGERWKSFKDTLTEPINLLDKERIRIGMLSDEEKKAIEVAERHMASLRRLSDAMVSFQEGIDKTIKTARELTALGYQLGNMQIIGAALAGVVQHARDEYEAAQQRARSFYESIVGPQRTFNENLRFAESLLQSGAISAAQYEKAVRGIIDAYGGGEIAELLKGAAGPAAAKPNSQAADFAAYQAQLSYDTDVAMKMAELENMKPDEPDLAADMAAMLERDGRVIEANAARTKAWHDELERLRQKSDQFKESMIQGLGQIADTIVGAALAGKTSMEDMLKTIGLALIKLAAMKALSYAAGQPTGFNMGNGGALSALNGLGGLVGFASGGVIMPGGSGGTDSQVVAFRKSPSETVRIHTPEQERAFSGGGRRRGGDGAPAEVRVYNISDRDAAVAAMDTRRGQRQIINTIDANRNLVRGAVSRR